MLEKRSIELMSMMYVYLKMVVINRPLYSAAEGFFLFKDGICYGKPYGSIKQGLDTKEPV